MNKNNYIVFIENSKLKNMFRVQKLCDKMAY